MLANDTKTFAVFHDPMVRDRLIFAFQIEIFLPGKRRTHPGTVSIPPDSKSFPACLPSFTKSPRRSEGGFLRVPGRQGVRIAYAGMIRMLKSTAGGEWVSAPTEMYSTPVSA